MGTANCEYDATHRAAVPAATGCAAAADYAGAIPGNRGLRQMWSATSRWGQILRQVWSSCFWDRAAGGDDLPALRQSTQPRRQVLQSLRHKIDLDEGYYLWRNGDQLLGSVSCEFSLMGEMLRG